ncbi:MAG: DUF3159 domain-containing protein [Anaerolineales bacterium]|nr:DUF3159 domain-containing protein [Anaerolineales bacterium]
MPEKVNAETQAQPNKWRELLEELRTVFAGRNSFLDAILPPIIFLVINGLISFQAAMWSALTVSIVIAIARIIRKQSLLYALAGVGSVAVAIGIAWFLGKSEGFFLPGLVSGSMTLLLAVVSLMIRRPMVAWTSYLARRWPLDWYWHPLVRPAYSEVTFAWTVFFAARLFLQFSLFENQNVNSLAITNFITGWPATILLLILSYLYGTWRLAQLRGPSVDEYREDTPAPWKSQRRGF